MEFVGVLMVNGHSNQMRKSLKKLFFGRRFLHFLYLCLCNWGTNCPSATYCFYSANIENFSRLFLNAAFFLSFFLLRNNFSLLENCSSLNSRGWFFYNWTVRLKMKEFGNFRVNSYFCGGYKKNQENKFDKLAS